MLYRSHRGGVAYTPENTMPAFEKALTGGFAYIETDPCLTKDGVIVLSHDKIINRTCRHADGSRIEGQVPVADSTYEELMAYDAGIAKGETFRGTKIPTLEALLAAAEGTGATITIDKFAKWHDGEELDALFALVAKYDTPVSFICETLEQIEKLQKRNPNVRIDWDGLCDEDTLKALLARVPYENLLVWLYLDTPIFAWLKEPLRKTSAENCRRVKQYARLGVANVNSAEDAKEALAFEPYIMEV